MSDGLFLTEFSVNYTQTMLTKCPFLQMSQKDFFV